uniref:Thioredoxin domain-containing protein n=1 Tax=Craspedostauros australis TaxID=1486917 RepID=A0A6T6DKH9_9STRA|eukprot:CAMPEP_0198111692 /NCGR_PEP_ID=MMETSP1442-20131203/3628_1 /TAXON_ID= /ORGANISM="Craspedostauros australis, Strain CCMP3328" /LENGTH=229 /DNA_ID=CAMNT_0043768225 /DNA_START=55 /DNA_END=744 /DNA_ORIENTATION=-
MMNSIRTFAAAVLLAAIPQASAGLVVLTNENYETATYGKSVFMKFYAPWCSHCREMADSWIQLAEDYEGHDVALIAEIDCTSDGGQVLCEDFEVQSFPTLLYGDPMSPETYDGKRDYDAMAEFAKNNINTRICSYFMKLNCNDEELELLDKLDAMSEDDLEGMAVKVETDVKEAEAAFDDQVGKLQVQYDELVAAFNQNLERIKQDSHYKYVEQILSSRFVPDSGKDEL